MYESSGKIGIGTTSPSGVIHAVNSSLTSTAIFERSGQTTDDIFGALRVLSTKTTDMSDGFGSQLLFSIQDNAATINSIGSIGAVRAGADNTGDIVFRTYVSGNSSERMRLTSAGKFGIGTTAPNNTLQSVGISQFSPTSADAGIEIQGEYVSGNNNQRMYFKENESSDLYGFSFIYAGNTNPTFNSTAFTLPTNTFYILNHDNSSTGNVAMSIARTTGNIGIGIGTSTASGILHAANSSLTSTAIFERSGQTADDNYAALRLLATKTTDMGDGFGSTLLFTIKDDAGTINNIANIGAVRTGADNTGSIIFRTYASGTSAENMRITSNGNIGIGTTSPVAKLEIKDSTANPAIIVRNQNDSIHFLVRANGYVEARDVLVKTGAIIPDYVFEKNYKLKSLNEVEKYVNEYKHLPDVPSASEVKNNGLNLVEMDATLLKKIEELTLYIIEQNKTITEQQQQINELKQNMNNIK